VDTGYQAPAVYAWARGAGFAQVASVPPAGRGSRMDQAAGRRTAGDRDDAARVPETRVAEAAGTQRGAGLPGLRARRRLDCRSGSVVRSEVARPRGPARACARPNRWPSRRG